MESPRFRWSPRSLPGPSTPAARSALVAALSTLALVGAAPLQGQASHEQPIPTDPWVEDVAIGMANAFTGGVTAAVTAWLRDEDVGRAMVRGMVGGAIVFGGKRIVVENFDGAGLLGRQVGAVGSSMVRNAGTGAPWLEEVWLPLGPLWVQANPRSPGGVRVDAWRVAVLGWAATRSELRVDWGASASNGAFVFRAPEHVVQKDGDAVAGLALGGLVLLSRDRTGQVRQTRGHELVHVVQLDFYSQALAHPLESWVWSRFTDWSVPVDIGLPPHLLPSFFGDLPEAEARALDSR